MGINNHLGPNSSQNHQLIVNYPAGVCDKICLKFGRTPIVALSGSSNVIYDPPRHFYLNRVKAYLLEKADITFYYHELSTKTWKKIKIKHLDDNQVIEFEDFNEPSIKYELKTYLELKEEGLTPPGTIAYTLPEVDAVSRSFSANLTYSGKVQSTLIVEYVCRSATIFNSGKIYAPYAVLSQSSGFGKSRGICEAGRRLASIYGVFRKKTDSGFPHQANWLNTFHEYINGALEDDIPHAGNFKVSEFKVGRVLIFINCLMSAFVTWFKAFIGERLFEELFVAKLKPSELSNEKIVKLCQVYDMITDSYKTGNEGVSILQEQLNIELGKAMSSNNISVDELCNGILSKAMKFVPLNKLIFKERNKMDREQWSEFIDNHFEGDQSHNVCPGDDQQSFPFLLILDEASVLNELTSPGQISTLTAIRRALHFIPSSDSFLVVTLGTNCDLSSLNKPVSDNSLRFSKRRNLLFPLILTGNWDIHAVESRLHELVVDKNFLLNHRTQLLSCSFGRALWSSLFINFMISTASIKIRNGSDDLYTAMIAVWCIRVGLTVHADPKLSEKLLRSHMATLVTASSNTERIIVNYSAEPVLAIAARDFIKDKKVDYFKNLLEFVEGVPTDRGKIGESIFSEILLQAMDKSGKMETFSDMKPPGASSKVLKILSTKKFLLEDSTDSDENSPLIDDWCKTHHRITNVQNFLSTLYSNQAYNKIKSFLPVPLLEGLVNFGQFIALHSYFPFSKFFDVEGYEDISSEKCKIFDKAIIKAGLLKKVAYMCPFGYFGLDAFIPLLLEVDVVAEIDPKTRAVKNLELHRNAQFSQSRTSSVADTEFVIVKKQVYSYIGVQFKVGKADKMATLAKTDPFLHLNPDEYESWEIEAIRENHLMLVMSSENDIEKSDLLFTREQGVREPFAVSLCTEQVLPAERTHEVVQQILGALFYRLPRSDSLQLSTPILISKPKFSDTVLKTAKYGQVKVAPHINVCGISLSENNKHSCIWSSSLLAFHNLLGKEVVDLCHQIIRSDRSIFKNRIDDFALKSVADAVLNTSFAYYPEADPMLRKFRNQKRIPPVLKNFDHWKNDQNVDNKVPKKNN